MSNSTAADWFVRIASRQDLPDLLAIEAESFPADGAWSEADFLQAVQSMDSQLRIIEPLGDGMNDQPVAGFMIFSSSPSHFELNNLAVSPGKRRRGAGSALLAQLKRQLTDRRPRIVTTVRESNLLALNFLKRQGFRCVGLLRGFYELTSDDAFRMVYQLPSAEQQQHTAIAHRLQRGLAAPIEPMPADSAGFRSFVEGCLRAVCDSLRIPRRLL